MFRNQKIFATADQSRSEEHGAFILGENSTSDIQWFVSISQCSPIAGMLLPSPFAAEITEELQV